MTTTLKSLSAAVCVALLAACGGGGNAALSRTFTYGAATTPSTTEQSAAATAQTDLSSTTSFSSAADVNKGAAVVGFADSMATIAFGSSVLAVAPNGTNLRAALRAADFSACSAVSGNTVTFTNCVETYSSFSLTLNGTITASAGTVTWNVNATFSGSQNGATFSVALHESGTLTVTSTKVTGDALVEISASASSNGQSASVAASNAVILDVTYDSGCATNVTGGGVEVKRVWTQKPSGASGSIYSDAGVKFTWPNCGNLTVQHSQ
jgi:hypothetical protein